MHRTNSAPLFCALMLFALTASCVNITAEDSTELPIDNPRRTTIVHANRSVQSLSRTLAAVMQRSEIEIATDAESNVLMFTGPQQEVDRAVKLLKALDQAPQIINIDVSIVVRNTKTGEDQILDELQLSTLNDVSTMLQFGQQVSVPEAAQRVSGRTMVRSYRHENVGTLVKATPRLVGDDIVLNLNLEKSWIEISTPAESDSEIDDVAIPTTYTTVAETTLRLKHGQSQTFQAVVSKGRDDGRDVLITVSATADTRTSTSTSEASAGLPREREQNRSGASRQSDGGRTSRAAGSRSGSRGGQRGGFGGGGPGDRGTFGGRSRGGFGGSTGGGNRGGFGGSTGATGGLRDERQPDARNRPDSEDAEATSKHAGTIPEENGDNRSTSGGDSTEANQMQTVGRRYFQVLDRDKDGHMNMEEWEASRRLRPMFEEAGITISSVTEDEFVKQFITATKHAQQKRKNSDE